MQNGYLERLNRFYREDVLDAYWFSDLHQIRTLTDKWKRDYNTRHPHSSLDDMPPRVYKNRFGEEFFPETTNDNGIFMNLAIS